MDKFGIFKLVNSFFEFYKQNSNGSPLPSFNLFRGGENAEKTQNAPTNDKSNGQIQRGSPKPLQQQMLETIRSHDKLLERVKKGKNTV